LATHSLSAHKAAARAKLPSLATGYCDATTDSEQRGTTEPCNLRPRVLGETATLSYAPRRVRGCNRVHLEAATVFDPGDAGDCESGDKGNYRLAAAEQARRMCTHTTSSRMHYGVPLRVHIHILHARCMQIGNYFALHGALRVRCVCAACALRVRCVCTACASVQVSVLIAAEACMGRCRLCGRCQFVSFSAQHAQQHVHSK